MALPFRHIHPVKKKKVLLLAPVPDLDKQKLGLSLYVSIHGYMDGSRSRPGTTSGSAAGPGASEYAGPGGSFAGSGS